MIDRATKLRLRRKLRRGQYRAIDMTQNADEGLEKHFIKRLGRLGQVRRFMFGWISLIVLLITGLILQNLYLSHYYQILKPAPGGIFTEGVVGTYTNANPIYATGVVDTSVSKLIFSGLLKYDQENRLVSDLADHWILDEHETLYTVKLKANLKWQDGQPITSKDVAFTFQTIQNPDAKSPLFSSWQGIKINTPDDLTVTFLLPSAFSPFPNSLTTGILPKHLLEKVPVAQMRAITFNTNGPVGSGPFKWQAIEVTGRGDTLEREQKIGFVPFDDYHTGKPQLAQFAIQTFKDEHSLINALLNGTVDAAIGLSAVPDELKNNTNFDQYNIPLTGAVFTFYKNSNPFLADVGVRKALVLAANAKEVIASLGYPVIIANEPLLKNQIGYSPDLTQNSFDLNEANHLLDSLGWLRDPTTGLRSKDGKVLSLKLFSQSTPEYAAVSQILQRQWRQAGIDVQVTLQADQDLQTTIAFHSYDILLYAISIGTDPDVFAYWHSSQADIRSPNRLNFSEYKSVQADKSLEAGRSRSDPALRSVKYRPFLEAWRSDNPALALYQPRFLYIVRKPLYGFKPVIINQSSDRYTNVQNWMVREQKATK